MTSPTLDPGAAAKWPPNSSPASIPPPPPPHQQFSQGYEHIDNGSHQFISAPGALIASWPGLTSTFRSLSTCNRCRLRKHRCDQNLPSCSSCEKVGARCTGYDPLTKREVPRGYVYYLESRVTYLETLLQNHHISFAPADAAWKNLVPGISISTEVKDPVSSPDSTRTELPTLSSEIPPPKQNVEETPDDLVSNIAMVPVQGASDARYLGSTSGISFARVVFAAIKSSINTTTAPLALDHGPSITGSIPSKAPGSTTMRDSFFGLHSKPTIKPAPFPNRQLGLKLTKLYFEHSNPMYPILHRGEFMKLFDRVYALSATARTPRQLYLLNIVFAIGAGIFLTDNESHGDYNEDSAQFVDHGSAENGHTGNHTPKYHPEEYHASAIVHLESVLSSPSAADKPSILGGGLEELQVVLLLASFALLRPIAPGLWYIVGVAVRLAVDLGLHYEDGCDIGDDGTDENEFAGGLDASRLNRKPMDSKERGKREWIRDFRRRLWWCVYSFDRLVSACVGRPVGISDQVITTELPSLLDDKYISISGFEPAGRDMPSYKHTSHHYFRLRLLQSEILQVLQHQHAWQARIRQGKININSTQMRQPFLEDFDSFRSWRSDIDRRLWEWKISSPTRLETGVEFSVEFFELNYWQTVVMLYRQSLSIPELFENEYNTANEVDSPSMFREELREDQDMVYLKVAEAGKRVLKLYRQLHLVHLVNYTFLDTHQLFMAGIAFLYAIWHSPIVRSKMTMEEVDFTVLAATSVLGDLTEKCPPALACRESFHRMSKATIQMCLGSTGFGNSVHPINSNKTNKRSYPRDSTIFDGRSSEKITKNSMGPGQRGFSHYRPDKNVDQDAAFGEASPAQPRRHQSQNLASSVMYPAFEPNELRGIPQKQTEELPSGSVPSFIDPDLSFEGLDFLRDGTGVTPVDTSGLDQTLGMGWEGDHDFGSGSQLDLFDGFFFGGTGNA